MNTLKKISQFSSIDTTRSIFIDDDIYGQEKFIIKKSYRHPFYKYPQTYNDIAISQLDRRVNYKFWQNQQIPSCLPNSDEDFTNKTASVQGYGKTQYGIKISNHYQQRS